MALTLPVGKFVIASVEGADDNGDAASISSVDWGTDDTAGGLKVEKIAGTSTARLTGVSDVTTVLHVSANNIKGDQISEKDDVVVGSGTPPPPKVATKLKISYTDPQDVAVAQG